MSGCGDKHDSTKFEKDSTRSSGRVQFEQKSFKKFTKIHQMTHSAQMTYTEQQQQQQWQW